MYLLCVIQRMTERITFAMQKGGVGKSTTTLNVAGALAAAGNDVLLADCDPQGFSTIQLGYTEYYEDPDAFTPYDALMDIDTMDRGDDLIRHHDEFDLLPSHAKNFNLEKALWNQSRTHERIGMLLDRLETDYDYVLLDAPPNLGPLADGALLAADQLVLVALPDLIATFSIKLLQEEVETLEKNFGTEIPFGAAVVNKVSATSNKIEADRLDWFEDYVGEGNVHTVPETVAIEGAFSQNGTVFNYEPESRHRASKAEEVRSVFGGIADRLGGGVDG